MICPHCYKEIDDVQAVQEIADSVVISRSQSLLSRRAPPASKARDPKKMSAAGKLGGYPKGRPRTPSKKKS